MSVALKSYKTTFKSVVFFFKNAKLQNTFTLGIIFYDLYS